MLPEMLMKNGTRVVLLGGMLAALLAAPGMADVKQVKLGIKGAT